MSGAELVERALALGLPAVALTDVDSLSAQPHFHDLCQRNELRAITGVELRFCASRADRRLVLLARNTEGYRSLCRIVTRRRGGAGAAEQRLAAEDPVAAVCRNPEGLFIMTDDADALGRLARARELERRDLRALLRRPWSPASERSLLRMAENLGVGAVADGAEALAAPADRPLERLLDAIRRGATLAEPDLFAASNAPASPVRAAAEERFADVPKLVAESHALADACRFALRRGAPLEPCANLFGAHTLHAELAARTAAALREARAGGRCRAHAYADQLAHELEVIDRLGYAGYFLAAAEVAAEARKLEIRLAPRGSAVASLAVHLLGISGLDPLAQGLSFERFLHAEREGAPDIDLDVCSRRRDELIRACYRRFGEARVAVVGAHHRYRLAGALRHGLGVLGVRDAEIERLLARLARHGVHEATPELAALPDVPYPVSAQALRTILRLVGIPRLLALHPGGMVVAPGPVADVVPVERAARGLTVAQYDAASIETTGLTKLDILGNRFLTQLGDTLELAAHGRPADAGPAPVERIPLDDAATLASIDEADTIGCFQIETAAMRALLMQLPIRSLADCVAAIALVRPGAAAGSVKREYVRRAHGYAPLHPPDPVIAETLRPTHGLLLYDEDLMRLASRIAGLPLAAADRLRTAVIEADREGLLELEAQFMQRAAAHGYAGATAEHAWQAVAQFAAYSFCKAHASSYAVMAYHCAYLKRHYPVEFACALLRSYGGAYPLRTIAADLARHGVPILPPSVNASDLESSVERDAGGAARGVRVGLTRIKRVSSNTAGAVIARRERSGPFGTVAELLAELRPSRRELEALVLTGACDGLAPLTPEAYPFAHAALLEGALDARRSAEPRADARTEARTAYSRLVRIRNELQYLGMHLADHPLRVLRAEAARYGCRTSQELRAGAPAAAVRFAGLVAASRRHKGEHAADPTLFLTLEDEEGLLETVVGEARYAELDPRLTTPGPYLVEGDVKLDYGRVYLEASAIWPFHMRARKFAARRAP